MHSAPVEALFLDPSPAGMLYAGTNGAGVAAISLPNIPPTGMTRLSPGAKDRPVGAPVRFGAGGRAQPISLADHDQARGVVSGPYGGTVIDLKIDPATPSTLYAATDSGVFQTTDSGESWHVAGLASTTVYALAVDPVNPLNVYAGTRAQGFYWSPDGGGTWIGPPDSLIQDKIIYTVAVDPATPQTIYGIVSQCKW
jgi:hypothetical protein